jgi:hypothetical protein
MGSRKHKCTQNLIQKTGIDETLGGPVRSLKDNIKMDLNAID